jgi:hypothetical protein
VLLLRIAALCAHLAASGRWTRERAVELVDDLGACGPPADAALRLAAGTAAVALS